MGHDSRRKPYGYPPLPLLRMENVIEEEPDQRLITKRYTDEALKFIEANRDGPFLLVLGSHDASLAAVLLGAVRRQVQERKVGRRRRGDRLVDGVRSSTSSKISGSTRTHWSSSRPITVAPQITAPGTSRCEVAKERPGKARLIPGAVRRNETVAKRGVRPSLSGMLLSAYRLAMYTSRSTMHRHTRRNHSSHSVSGIVGSADSSRLA